MAHVGFPDPAQLPADARTALAGLPVQLNIFRAIANAPTLVAPSIAMGRALLTTLKLAPDLRELVILRTAARTGALYEWTQHVPIGLAAGVTDRQLTALHAGDLSPAVFTSRELAALGVVELIAQGVDEGRFAVLRQHFDDQEIVELLWVGGYYHTLARIMTVLSIEVDPSGEQLAGVITEQTAHAAAGP